MSYRSKRRWSVRVRVICAAGLVLGAGACNDVNAPAAKALVVKGSGTATAAATARFASDAAGDEWLYGAAGSLTMKLYALYISPNADCSAPVLVQQLGSDGVDKDFMKNPVLFEGTPPSGTYPCVMFKMSDVLRMTPAESFGACAQGTLHSGDIYRDGETDWKDAFLDPIIGRGSDEEPVDDRVTIFMTRDPDAAMARGISPNQVVPLGADLIVPGQSTLTLDASQSVITNGVECGLNPPAVSFR